MKQRIRIKNFKHINKNKEDKTLNSHNNHLGEENCNKMIMK